MQTNHTNGSHLQKKTKKSQTNEQKDTGQFDNADLNSGTHQNVVTGKQTHSNIDDRIPTPSQKYTKWATDKGHLERKVVMPYERLADALLTPMLCFNAKKPQHA